MWFTRSASGFRGWIAIEVAGVLRPGLTTADFTVTIITSDDDASTSAVVSESTQLPGVYFFDVSSAFLLANGVGQYNVIISTDTTLGSESQPPVLDVYTEMLNVAAHDFDSLSGEGLTSTQATMMLEMYKLMGLDPTKPLVV